MKFCTKCGNEVSDTVTFCPHCGNQLGAAPNVTVVNVQAPPPQPMAAPVGQLKTGRSMVAFILLSLITFGIYGLVVMSNVSTDINTIASRYDGKRTMHFCLVFFIFSWLTLGIVPLVWYHKISARIGMELGRRRIPYSFGASDFWLWNILGCLIIVGPFVYLHKLLKAMNLLSENYNRFG